MGIVGLDLFKKYFANYEGMFVLIGGAACDQWFSDQGLTFRSTTDLDIVLIREELNPEFIRAFMAFVDEGGYSIKRRSDDGPPVLYRFENPTEVQYPTMLELLSRTDESTELNADQSIIPVRIADAQSLSAILLNQSYYNFLLGQTRVSDGVLMADHTALIPLKAKAWLDLSRRRSGGEEVRGSDIKKHRNDVFRLAATLPGKPFGKLPEELDADLVVFMKCHPENDECWPAIQAAVKSSIRTNLNPETLVAALAEYFELSL